MCQDNGILNSDIIYNLAAQCTLNIYFKFLYWILSWTNQVNILQFEKDHTKLQKIVGLLQKFENGKWNQSEQYSLHMSFPGYKMQTGAKMGI